MLRGFLSITLHRITSKNFFTKKILSVFLVLSRMPGCAAAAAEGRLTVVRETVIWEF